jgi:hypothetical protein
MTLDLKYVVSGHGPVVRYISKGSCSDVVICVYLVSHFRHLRIGQPVFFISRLGSRLGHSRLGRSCRRRALHHTEF